MVGLYFSAHWCPPCRGFTPRLAKEYERMKGEGKKIEIVFISSDKSKVIIIVLVIIIVVVVLVVVIGLYFSADWCPPCRGFTPRLAKEYERMKGEGKKIEIVFISSDRSKVIIIVIVLIVVVLVLVVVIGLYFSADWCPPCRGFTPRLAKEYERMKGEGKKIEIVFISSDRSKVIIIIVLVIIIVVVVVIMM